MNQENLKEEILKDPLLRKVSRLVEERGIPLFLVGGYIRDLLLRRKGNDYDLAFPKEISFQIPSIEAALGLRFFKVGKEESGGVSYRFVKPDRSIDLTPFQGKTIDEDRLRRDFTINAIAFSLADGTFHAFEGAWEDVSKRLIRAVSSLSIDRDPLRSLRAVRYLSILDGFTIDPRLEKEIVSKSGRVLDIPGERIKAELDEILLSPRPGMGMRRLEDLRLLAVLIPEVQALEDLKQNGYHHLTGLAHTLLMIEKIPGRLKWAQESGMLRSLTEEELLSLYYASLLHDIGKPDTYSEDEHGRIHFYHHERFSCKKAEGVMERLRFSNSLRERVLRIIKNHMRIHNLPQEAREPALKRLVNEVGDEIPLLVVHTLADKEASRGILSTNRMDEVAENHCIRLLEIFEENEVVHPPRLITGHDVMALGYAAGPTVGEILEFIRQKQVEGEIKTREDALEALKQMFLLEGEF